MQQIIFPQSSHSSQYEVIIGENLADTFAAVAGQLHGRRVLILTDERIAALHLANVEHLISGAGAEASSFVLKGGEASKGFRALQKLLSELLTRDFSRDDWVINLGGGVVSDLGGFAAAIYMRGMNYANIPTSLLGMVDSALGGKTGIDFMGVKNSVGAIAQPKFVLSATELLSSLPERDKRSAFGEIIKYAAIDGGSGLVDAIRNKAVNEAMIAECCRIKLHYVSGDEHDGGKRRILNLGHTFGHAFEAASAYDLRHGEAVALGLVAAMRFGEGLGIVDGGVSESIAKLADFVGLCTNFSHYARSAAKYLVHDKKIRGSSIEMAFVRSLGQPFLMPVPIERAIGFLAGSDRAE